MTTTPNPFPTDDPDKEFCDRLIGRGEAFILAHLYRTLREIRVRVEDLRASKSAVASKLHESMQLVAELTNERDGLLADKVRLDWLQAHADEMEIRFFTRDALHYYAPCFQSGKHETLRSAIDAAKSS